MTLPAAWTYESLQRQKCLLKFKSSLRWTSVSRGFLVVTPLRTNSKAIMNNGSSKVPLGERLALWYSEQHSRNTKLFLGDRRPYAFSRAFWPILTAQNFRSVNYQRLKVWVSETGDFTKHAVVNNNVEVANSLSVEGNNYFNLENTHIFKI